jgi:hypothetical protein
MTNALELFVEKIGGELLPDNAQWTNRFNIRSESSSRLYVIAKNKSTGEVGCSCLGWKRARNGVRSCKHLDAIMPALTRATKDYL